MAGEFCGDRVQQVQRGPPGLQADRTKVMRQIPHLLLWLGHAGDGQDFRRIFDTGIQALVHLAAEEPTVEAPRDLVYCRFPLVDGPGNDRKLLELAILTVANLLEKNLPTLVCCGAGLSRSPIIAAAAMALVSGQSADDCLKQVTEHCPADVSPALWEVAKTVVEEGRASSHVHSQDPDLDSLRTCIIFNVVLPFILAGAINIPAIVIYALVFPYLFWLQSVAGKCSAPSTDDP